MTPKILPELMFGLLLAAALFVSPAAASGYANPNLQTSVESLAARSDEATAAPAPYLHPGGMSLPQGTYIVTARKAAATR